ncbi:BZ3500_MvSof-1268-A1-R1_Chr1-3g02436 [Microbotryum saponariae]|uniref:BZ3500_MvSof-1268-A1-R1_Chr1-3g02436 protein n=1 Tax=Microbotryum saponariae TaxID=289078 RepID=A0A2X0L5J8_9BASI|nr:BZ3500_MvSof-1268-A1-R1_Chr1-3g02436 [Microbotryum saponariae]SCZ96223.1 BZ3501_MvSof-1269-A2-R1_Chr1-3g02039 [Microbotryum saponariae]
MSFPLPRSSSLPRNQMQMQNQSANVMDRSIELGSFPAFVHTAASMGSAPIGSVPSVDQTSIAQLDPRTRAAIPDKAASYTYTTSFEPLPPKIISLSTIASSQNERSRSTSAWNPRNWPWPRIEAMWWAASPLLFHILGMVLLLISLVECRIPYLSIVQVGEGTTGRLDYSLLASCAVAPGTTEQVCTKRHILADYIPSLLLVSPAMPAFTALKLIFVSQQTPPILLSGLCLLAAAFLVYIPFWILAYFPNTKTVPALLEKFYRYHAKHLLLLVFILVLPAFVLTLTSVIGFHLLCQGNAIDFSMNMLAAFEAGLLGGSITAWKPEFGHGFNILWTAVAFQAATVIALGVAMFNELHEVVEWPEMQKGKVFW